jgi:FkbM family methyltransferase
MKGILRACRPGFEIVLADVGSAGGLKGRWAPARPIVSAILFEPRDGGEPRRAGRDTLYPVVLGPQGGRATLNLTSLPNMSSTLRPNQELLGTFRKKGSHTQITGSIEVPMDTLDAVAALDGRQVDAIKVDTQGTELGILEGAKGCLARSCLIAEIEVSFLERYRGQALFRDIEAYMMSLGFELVDLYRLKRYRRLNSSGIGNISLGGGQRAGRLAYGDAFFMLREDRLLERIVEEGEDVAMKIIISLLVYGKADIAAAIFDRTAERFEPKRREAVAKHLRALGRKVRRNSFHHLVDYLARHV